MSSVNTVNVIADIYSVLIELAMKLKIIRLKAKLYGADGRRLSNIEITPSVFSSFLTPNWFRYRSQNSWCNLASSWSGFAIDMYFIWISIAWEVIMFNSKLYLAHITAFFNKNFKSFSKQCSMFKSKLIKKIFVEFHQIYNWELYTWYVSQHLIGTPWWTDVARRILLQTLPEHRTP